MTVEQRDAIEPSGIYSHDAKGFTLQDVSKGIPGKVSLASTIGGGTELNEINS
jgi:hypothetical protein